MPLRKAGDPMNDTKRNIPPQDEGVYQTGAVVRPRSHGGLVVALLVTVVLLGGIITILSMLNIQLFVALKTQEKDALRLQNTMVSTSQTVTAVQPKQFSVEVEERQQSLTPQEIYANCMASVVSLRGEGVNGTGLVLTADGYILTDWALVKGVDTLTVELADRRCLTGHVVGMDPMMNLAVVHVEASDLTAPSFGDSDALNLGDAVISIGDPLGSHHDGTLSNSTVSSLNGNMIGVEGFQNHTGPLLNRFGQVVGFQIGTSERAIPSVLMIDIAEQLVNQGYVSGRPGLGIQCQPVPELYQNYYTLPAGLYVTAAEGDNGLAVGDILVSLKGKVVACEEDLMGALYTCKVGDAVAMEVYRNERICSITVEIVEAKG